MLIDNFTLELMCLTLCSRTAWSYLVTVIYTGFLKTCFKYIILYSVECMDTCMYVCIHMCYACGSQRASWDLLKLECRQLWAAMWVLEAKIRSSTGACSALNHWTISLFSLLVTSVATGPNRDVMCCTCKICSLYLNFSDVKKRNIRYFSNFLFFHNICIMKYLIIWEFHIMYHEHTHFPVLPGSCPHPWYLPLPQKEEDNNKQKLLIICRKYWDTLD